MRRPLLAAVTALTLLATGCADPLDAEPRRLTVAVSLEPSALDPIVSNEVPATEPIRNVFETLVTVDSRNRVRPMLADSFAQSADGREITFRLRDGVRFHDGSTMDAADVVASMNRWITLSSAGMFHFPGSKFVEVDERTVVLRMRQPSSTALLDLAYGSSNLPAIMPAEIAKHAGAQSIDRYVGTGPFRFVSWDKGQRIVLRTFRGYVARQERPDGLAGDRTPAYDELVYAFVPDASTATLGVEAGEYDVAADLPYDNTDWLRSRGLRVGVTPRTSLPNLYFNKKRGLFADRRARRALAMGLNRKALMRAAFSDERFYGITSDFMASALDNLWDSDVGAGELGRHDVREAKRLLADAGYRGETVTILTSRDSRQVYFASVVLQGQLRKLGIDADLSTYDYATMVGKMSVPAAWDLVVILNFTKLEPTQMAFFRADFPGWTKDRRLDEVMARFRGAPNIQAARPYYDDLQRWFVDYVPVVKLGEASGAYAYRRGVTGIQATDSTLVLWTAEVR